MRVFTSFCFCVWFAGNAPAGKSYSLSKFIIFSFRSFNRFLFVSMPWLHYLNQRMRVNIFTNNIFIAFKFFELFIQRRLAGIRSSVPPSWYYSCRHYALCGWTERNRNLRLHQRATSLIPQRALACFLETWHHYRPMGPRKTFPPGWTCFRLYVRHA